MMMDIGAITSQGIGLSECFLSAISTPATYEFVNFGFEQYDLEDTNIVIVSGHNDERKIGDHWISDERRATPAAERNDLSTQDKDATRWRLLCSQLLTTNEEAVPDEDLLALLLSYLKSGINSRALAMQLITRFETLGNVVSARSAQIAGAAPIGPEIINFLRVVRAAGTRLAREQISNRPILDAWEKLINYLRSAMAHEPVEQFRVLFLDRRNMLIADELQHRGTIDHTPVYPREVARRALELDASAIIMVHNHPSNHPAPSKADIEMTRIVRDTVAALGIVLHDHIIISRRGHTSFQAMGLLESKTH